MNADRFKEYDNDVKQLVLNFEDAQRQGLHPYYDMDEMEIIIDFYLESADADMLEKSVVYGEQLFPQSTSMRLRRAHLLCTKERFSEAYAILSDLERLEPDNTDVLYALGAVCSALEHPRKAIRYYQMASVDQYELDTIYSNIADEYFKLFMFKESRMYARKALKVNPHCERALYMLSDSFFEDGAFDEAEHFFAQFVKDHPYSKVGWYCLAMCYMDASLFEKAIDALEYAIAIDKFFIRAYEQVCECYMQLNDIGKAAAVLNEATAYADDKAVLFCHIGDIYRESSNLNTGLAYYRKAVAADPRYDEAWIKMALCYVGLDAKGDAVDAVKKALQINTYSPQILSHAAVVYALCANDDAAEDLFQTTVEAFPDFDLNWTLYADFLIDRSRIEEALDIISKGLSECADPLDLHIRQAYCYFVLGRRNLLFDAVRACLYDSHHGAKHLLEYCPGMAEDLDVMNVIDSYYHDKEIHNDI